MFKLNFSRLFISEFYRNSQAKLLCGKGLWNFIAAFPKHSGIFPDFPHSFSTKSHFPQSTLCGICFCKPDFQIVKIPQILGNFHFVENTNCKNLGEVNAKHEENPSALLDLPNKLSPYFTRAGTAWPPKHRLYLVQCEGKANRCSNIKRHPYAEHRIWSIRQPKERGPM